MPRKTSVNSLRCIPLGLAALVMSGGMTSAKAQTTLVLADTFPDNHFVHDLVTRPFMARATQLAGGQLTFLFRPGGAAGDDAAMLSVVQNERADIGLVTPALAPEAFPLSSVAELPDRLSGACPRMKAAAALTRPGGLVARTDFARNRIHPLATFVLASYPVILRAHADLGDPLAFHGLRLRTVNDAMDRTVRALGGIPVQTDPGRIAQAVANGEIDGALVPYKTVQLYRMSWVAAGTQDTDFGAVLLTYSISERRWRRLPKKVQRALATAGAEVSVASCTALDQIADVAKREVAAAGADLATRSNPRAFDRLFVTVREDWVRDKERQGLPGGLVLRRYDAAARK